MKIFISSMIYSEWYEIKELIARGFIEDAYIPGEINNDLLALGMAVEKAVEAGFFTADQVLLLAGTDARVDAEFETKKPIPADGYEYDK